MSSAWYRSECGTAVAAEALGLRLRLNEKRPGRPFRWISEAAEHKRSHKSELL